MNNPSAELDRHVSQLGIISFAIVSGVLLFAGVVWYLVNLGGFSPPSGMPTYLGTGLNLLGLVIIAKAYLLPKYFQPRPSGAPEEELLAWHKRTTILGFALREAGAFAALVGVLLTGQQVGGFAVAALAVVTMIFAWPRREQLGAGP